jgi:hypothetical protein
VSEIALTVLKVLFLALLWLFIFSAASVIRTDLFGKAVPAPDQPEAREVESPQPPARRTRRPRGDPRVLSIVQGRQTGEMAELTPGPVLIGRSADCQLVLDDDYVSTRHARVVDGESGLYIEDLGSTNGTYVNGARITAPTAISLSDTLRIGKTILKLEP